MKTKFLVLALAIAGVVLSTGGWVDAKNLRATGASDIPRDETQLFHINGKFSLVEIRSVLKAVRKIDQRLVRRLEKDDSGKIELWTEEIRQGVPQGAGSVHHLVRTQRGHQVVESKIWDA